MTEAAQFFSSPGISWKCRLPGRNTLTVGHGEGSGGAIDLGDASCVVDSWARTRLQAARKGKMEITLFLKSILAPSKQGRQPRLARGITPQIGKSQRAGGLERRVRAARRLACGG